MAEEQIELRVVGVRFEEPDYAPVLILREMTGNRVLPIWIGASAPSNQCCLKVVGLCIT